MVYPLLPRGREGKAMAIQSLSGQGPASFGALLGEAIMRHFGFTALFGAAASLCCLLQLRSRWCRKMHRKRITRHRPRPRKMPVVTSRYCGNRALMPLWIVTFCFGFAISSRGSFIAPFAYRQGIASIGVYFTLYGVVAVFVRLSGSLMDRFGLDRMIAPSFAVMGVGIALSH